MKMRVVDVKAIFLWVVRVGNEGCLQEVVKECLDDGSGCVMFLV